jgi:tryptophan synthase alpha chain
VTGTKAVPEDEVRAAMARVRAATSLPCTVGFGIRSPEQAAAIAKVADGVVVGSAIVSKAAANLDQGRDKVVAEVLALVAALAGSTHAARRGKVEA